MLTETKNEVDVNHFLVPSGQTEIMRGPRRAILACLMEHDLDSTIAHSVNTHTDSPTFFGGPVHQRIPTLSIDLFRVGMQEADHLLNPLPPRTNKYSVITAKPKQSETD